MKRGFTKPFSRGRLGAEQREEANRIKSINFHLRNGDTDAAARLAQKTTEGKSINIPK